MKMTLQVGGKRSRFGAIGPSSLLHSTIPTKGERLYAQGTCRPCVYLRLGHRWFATIPTFSFTHSLASDSLWISL